MTNDERTIGETNLQEIVDITPQRKNVILDATVLSTLMGCGRLTDFRFNHNFQSIGGKSNALEVGSIVHKFLEVYYGSIVKGVRKQDAVGFGFTAAELYIQSCPHCTNFEPTEIQLKPECGHEIDEYPGLQNTPKDSAQYTTGWQDALNTCEQYIEYWKNDFWVPLEVESVRSDIMYQDDRIRVLWKAKFDGIFDTNAGIRPVDHKTEKQKRQSLKLNNQFMGQCWLMKTNTMFKNHIGFQKSLKPEEKFFREGMNYSDATLFEFQSEIVPYWANMLLMYAESEYWPPNLTHCDTKYGSCAFHEVCEANPDMREEVLKIEFKVGKPWNPTSAAND